MCAHEKLDHLCTVSGSQPSHDFQAGNVQNMIYEHGTDCRNVNSKIQDYNTGRTVGA